MAGDKRELGPQLTSAAAAETKNSGGRWSASE